MKPTLAVQWKDLETKPYLIEVLGSGILKDLVVDVALEGVPIEEATETAQARAPRSSSGRAVTPRVGLAGGRGSPARLLPPDR